LVGAQRREFEERFRQWKMLEMTKKGAEQNEEVAGFNISIFGKFI
jgi:hypothetical protein